MGKSFTKIFGQSILVGLLTGIICFLFRLGIESLFNLIMTNIYSNSILFLLITTLGGLLAGYLVFKFAPETSGSGIPYVKMSLLRTGKLIRIRTIFVKFISGVIGIGTGLSLGREGPSVQLGAGVGSFVGKICKLNGNNRDKLIASGAGAAIGATFNAPIAGTLFVLEELIHKFNPAMLFPTLLATVVAASIVRLFLGTNPCFNVIFPHTNLDINLIIACLVLGLISGMSGVLFSKTIFLFNNLYSKIKIPAYIKPAIAGFCMGLVGLVLPYVLSSGNGTVELLVQNSFSIKLVMLIFLIKFIMTPLCFGSGACGGIFLPMLVLGSFLGYIVGFIVNHLGLEVNLVAMSVIGMAGFLSSVARTPLTAVVMVFEMTGGYECILPIMLTAALADIISEKLNHKPIYSQLVVGQYQKSNMDISKKCLVKDVMTQNVNVFGENANILEILDIMKKENHNAYPVIDKKERLVGIITKSDIEDILVDSKMKNVSVNRIMETNPVKVLGDNSLYVAYYRLHENSTEWAIVVDKKQKVLGIITRRDILTGK